MTRPIYGGKYANFHNEMAIEQPSPALEIMDCGFAVGRTRVVPEQPSQASTVGILPCSNREGFYINESHKEFDGDISKLMGALA